MKTRRRLASNFELDLGEEWAVESGSESFRKKRAVVSMFVSSFRGFCVDLVRFNVNTLKFEVYVDFVPPVAAPYVP
jgi:hypothetical protein